jgi:hypothetical protein
MDNLFLNRVNSWQGFVKKEQESIFEISFKDAISAMRLFFPTIPKPLKQHPL